MYTLNLVKHTRKVDTLVGLSERLGGHLEKSIKQRRGIRFRTRMETETFVSILWVKNPYELIG